VPQKKRQQILGQNSHTMTEGVRRVFESDLRLNFKFMEKERGGTQSRRDLVKKSLI
jgi:hypothetical protein